MIGRLVSRTIYSAFKRRLDQDDRSIDDQLMGERCRGRWRTPVGNQQQSRKRASDEDEVAGYGLYLAPAN
jgi:hypothetical protein